jgi:hypothetical protein
MSLATKWIAFGVLSLAGNTLGCASTSRPGVEAAPSPPSTTQAGEPRPRRTREVGEEVPEFQSTDSARWVNGAPFTFASARGDVVLVESWHRL